ncbi:hypothetical protein RND71_003472 [Anisodus tanguticus]|uniref:Uncharacterized protein n=1 Tax=Anisodus tanguticus TaxID=243964 RepID=A0AAE1SWQ5_9SOLA|nr:hypothetical protein RND71_003472 [Anisodus tanguticus]
MLHYFLYSLIHVNILDTVQHRRLFSGLEKSVKVLARKTKLAFFNLSLGPQRFRWNGVHCKEFLVPRNFRSTKLMPVMITFLQRIHANLTADELASAPVF